MNPLLIIRFGSLGDVILSFAAGRSLKKHNPHRLIHFLVKESYAKLVGSQPWVDQLHVMRDEDRDAAGARRLRRELSGTTWCGVLDLQDSPRSRLLRSGPRAPVSVWKASRWARRFQVWGRPVRRFGVHPPVVRPEWLRFADAAEMFGTEDLQPPRVEWSREVEARLSDTWEKWMAGKPSDVIAIAPAAQWRTKEWPVARTRDLLLKILAEGNRVLLVSTTGERVRLAELDALRDKDNRIKWLTDDLLSIAAALARCRAAVTPDSGLMHLAAAVGTPVVTLFGSTVPALGFSPAGHGHQILSRALSCQPCALHGKNRCPLGHLDCLNGISSESVWRRVEAILDSPVLSP